MEAAIILLIIVAAAAALAGPVARKKTEFPYASRMKLLTRAELHFHTALTAATAPTSYIMAKVRLADIIDVRHPLQGSRRVTALNRIMSKHIDFVICDRTSSAIQCAVELHDRTHNAPSRRARDNFVREALKAANVPYLEVAAQRNYDNQSIRQQLANSTGEGPMAGKNTRLGEA